MKLKNIKTPLILGSLVTLALTGCLKDNYYDTHQAQAFSGGTTEVISLGLDVASADNVALLAYDNSDNDTTVELVPVELGGPNAAAQDIQVTLEKADDIVDSTNDADGSDFVIPAADQVVIPTLQVTIPAGQRKGFLKVSFKPSSLIGTTFALGFRIASVSPSQGYVIGNLAQGMAILLIKNKFDGKYKLTQRQTGWIAYGIADGPTYVWPTAVGWATTGALSNIFETPQGGNLQPAFADGGAITVFGAAEPQFTFDDAGKLLEVVNLIPPDSRNRAYSINPAVTDSRFDEATHNIYAAYILNQTGRPPQYIYDTLTYLGPR